MHATHRPTASTDLAMRGDDDVVSPGGVLLDLADQVSELVGEVPPGGVGDVEGGGTRLDHLAQDL